MPSDDLYGLKSPAGHVFGVEGWNWGIPVPTSITFFIDNTCKVCDQHGRPIRGVMIEGRGAKVEHPLTEGMRVLFSMLPPQENRTSKEAEEHAKLSTHAQVIAALLHEKIDWTKLVFAGWPQVSYDELKGLRGLPAWPFADEHDNNATTRCYCLFCCVRDPIAREGALRVRQEHNSVRERESAAAHKANQLAQQPTPQKVGK